MFIQRIVTQVKVKISCPQDGATCIKQADRYRTKYGEQLRGRAGPGTEQQFLLEEQVWAGPVGYGLLCLPEAGPYQCAKFRWLQGLRKPKEQSTTSLSIRKQWLLRWECCEKWPLLWPACMSSGQDHAWWIFAKHMTFPCLSQGLLGRWKAFRFQAVLSNSRLLNDCKGKFQNTNPEKCSKIRNLSTSLYIHGTYHESIFWDFRGGKGPFWPAPLLARGLL